MKEEAKEKVQDYISSFHESARRNATTGIGAILLEESGSEETKRILNEHYITAVVEAEGKHPDIYLEHMISDLEKGKLVVLHVISPLDPKIQNQLHEIADGKVYTTLASREEPVVINPLPDGAGVVLLMDMEAYAQFNHHDLIVSVCRI